MVWTQKEIEGYAPRDNAKLKQLYSDKGLFTEDPESIAKFLAEDYLLLTMTDHDLIMRIASKKGRAYALNILEEMAIDFSK
ncbi:MAG: hypothetical protein KJ721_00550 [Nanoarchaeota archaeon]|nr:hypothetical protein [Nanoarchaeota archaeon]